MGRIVASVRIENPLDPNARIRCDALVDTGASFMVLPSAWRERLGQYPETIASSGRLAWAPSRTSKTHGPEVM